MTAMKYRTAIGRGVTVLGALSLLSFLAVPDALACRFTVRDVGFVDLGSPPYHLYGFVKNDTPEEAVTTFRRIARAALIDSNVDVEMVNIDTDRDHPGFESYLKWKPKSFPAAVLVSPEDRSLALPFPESEETFKEQCWTLMESIVNSPLREDILNTISDTYGVIVLVEGANAKSNRMAEEVAQNGIKGIDSRMDLMPKAVGKSPILRTVKAEAIEREKILLWSLGIDFDAEERSDTGPKLAVLYGRARRIGTLLESQDITERSVSNLLSLIGLNCECGLDRKWMMGVMMPHRWSEDHQRDAFERLGFDADSPLVKTEISQILSLGGSKSPSEVMSGGLDDILMGYSEGTVELDGASVEMVEMPAVARESDDASDIEPVAGSATDTSPPSSSAPTSAIEQPEQPGGAVPVYGGPKSWAALLMLGLFGLLALMTIGGGMLILILARRRNG